MENDQFITSLFKMEMIDSYRSLPDDGTDFIRSKKGAQKG